MAGLLWRPLRERLRRCKRIEFHLNARLHLLVDVACETELDARRCVRQIHTRPAFTSQASSSGTGWFSVTTL